MISYVTRFFHTMHHLLTFIKTCLISNSNFSFHRVFLNSLLHSVASVALSSPAYSLYSVKALTPLIHPFDLYFQKNRFPLITVIIFSGTLQKHMVYPFIRERPTQFSFLSFCPYCFFNLRIYSVHHIAEDHTYSLKYFISV